MSDTLSPEALANLAEMREAAGEDPDADDDDQEEDGEPGPDPEPELPSDKEMEEIGKKLDAEARRHKKRVADILRDQMGDLVDCPLCVTPGFVTVIPPEDFDPIQRMAVLGAMGDVAAPKLKPHPYFYTCPTCEGWGELETGAKKQTTAIEPCPDCQGFGYKDRRAETGNAPVQVPPTYAPLPPVQIPPPNGATPEWTPPGSPPKPELIYDYATQTWRLP